jgi:hypothetical protein
VNLGGLTHPDLLASLPLALPETCTVQTATYTTTSTGVKTTTWAILSGHAALACRVSPVTTSTPEYQNLDEMDLTRSHRVIALAYHPDIEPGLRVVADGITYTVRTVRHDGQGLMTVLLCEEVSVG